MNSSDAVDISSVAEDMSSGAEDMSSGTEDMSSGADNSTSELTYGVSSPAESWSSVSDPSLQDSESESTNDTQSKSTDDSAADEGSDPEGEDVEGGEGEQEYEEEDEGEVEQADHHSDNDEGEHLQRLQSMLHQGRVVPRPVSHAHKDADCEKPPGFVLAHARHGMAERLPAQSVPRCGKTARRAVFHQRYDRQVSAAGPLSLQKQPARRAGVPLCFTAPHPPLHAAVGVATWGVEDAACKPRVEYILHPADSWTIP